MSTRGRCFLTPAWPTGPSSSAEGGPAASKMRYVAAQFEVLLHDDLWIRNGRHANEMATRLAAQVEAIDGVKLSRRPEVNSVFASLPRPAIEALQAWSFFWDWDVAADEVRWMTSYDTTVDDLDRFTAGVREALASG